MFDWNDEELDNIIWGEAAESDDHIVPYPKGSEERPLVTSRDHNKKEWKLESATKTPGDKTDFRGNQLESISNFDTNELSSSGFGMESWPDLSLSNAAKTDQDSMGTEVSKILTGITNYDISIGAERARLDKDHESFQNRHEDKEQNDFIDYGWANIGSFDDLDKIFSNNDPIFGHVSLGNADELWSSSKDVSNSPEKSFPLSADSPSLGFGVLRNASEHFKIKTEYVQDEDQSLTPDHGKMSDPTSHGLQNVHAITDQVENEGGKSKPLVKEQTALDMVGKTATSNSSITAEYIATPNKFTYKVNKQRKVLKYRKKPDEKSEGKLLQYLYGTWSPPENQFQQFEKQVTPSQQRQLQGPESLPYQHISNPYVAPYVYGNLTNQYPAISVLPRFHSGEDNLQMLSGYEVSVGNASHLNKSLDGPLKPLTMTPQEKVEKLRRRQQMQAMLAIQKQQQQFSHQVSSTDHSITQKCPPGIKIQHIEGADIEVEENLSTFPPLDPNSPIEQDDSNTISMAIDDYSVEETVLYHLQDIISKLDIKIRLCIRDSLFRLAQSAMQRHDASDTSSINKNSRDEHEAVTKEEISSHNRYAKIPNVETETNPIDRTVAHLLFHKPLEIPGKHPETPESPISTKLTCEPKTASLVNLSMGCLPDNSENKQNFLHEGTKTPCPLAELQHGDQFENSPCKDTSENVSNNELADGGAMKVEASH